MSIIQTIATVTIPLAALLLPAIFFIRLGKTADILGAGSRIILWNLGLLSLGTVLLSVLHMPVIWYGAFLATASLIGIWMRRKTIFTISSAWHMMAIITPLVIAYGAFTVPYLLIHDGLPTGDSQKAIFWAEQIIETSALPNYSLSQELLNRDPVDFYTPALHAFTAFIMSVSGHPFLSIGLQSIALAVAVAWIGAAIAKDMFSSRPYLIPPLITALLILTNFRFLRYLREPGYHYQNIMGELLLFGLLFLVLHFIRRYSHLSHTQKSDAALAVLTLATLALSHQFSAFISAFVIAGIALVFIVAQRSAIRHFIFQHTSETLASTALLILIGAIGIHLNLHHKLPHLFTTNPHLLHLTPPITDYPLIIGQLLLFAGLAGIAVMAMQAKHFQAHRVQVAAFAAALGTLAILSQGPRFFINIPPVRASLYLIVPLSIAASYFFGNLFQHIRAKHARPAAALLITIVLIGIAAPATASLLRAYETTSHSIRTNSTFTAGQQNIIDYLRQATAKPGAVIIDDYNRRSSSWLIFSKRPTYTRLASSLGRQMDEASQSRKRYDLYIRQLDYEKIYALGGRPEIHHLLAKHNIAYVAGIERSSSSAFMHNPSLRPAITADTITLYEKKQEAPACADGSDCTWLLRASTLANDIGNREDTFEYLPASIRSARLSDPQHDGTTTFRLTTASVIPITFNVGSYVEALWDKEKTGMPDTALELLVQFTAMPGNLYITSALHDTRYSVEDQQSFIRIPPREAAFDDKGLLTFYIHNPNAALVGIDLIALGLARTP